MRGESPSGGVTPEAMIERLLAFVVAVVAVVPSVGRLLWTDFAWMPWSDRDLARSQGAGLWTETMGAELSYGVGARVPGGLMHLLYGLPMAVGGGPVAAYRLQGALEVAALLAMVAWLLRRFGAAAAAAALAAWTTTSIASNTMAGLWNPALVPLFAAVAGLALLEQAVAPRRSLPWVFGLACGLGAQLHMSQLVFALAGGLGMVALSRRRLEAMVLVVVGVLVPYLPYLAVEAASGWGNTTMMLGPSQGEDVIGHSDRGRYFWVNVDALADIVMARRLQEGIGDGLAANVLWDVVGVVGAGVAIAAAAWLRGPAARGVVVVVLALGFYAAWFLTSGRVQLDASGASRYFIAVLPVASLVVGMVVGSSPPRARLALLIGALLVGGPRVVAWWRLPPYLSESAVQFGHLWNGLRGLEMVTPYRGRDLLRRTVILDAGWLARRGEVGVVSIFGDTAPMPAPEGPCLYIYGGLAPKPLGAIPGEERLIDSMPPGATAVRVGRSWRIGDRVRVASFTVTGAPCPTSFSNRYIPTGVEPQLLAVAEDLSNGDVVSVVPGAPGWTATRVGDAVLGVFLAAAGDQVQVRLEANALRGRAYNDGWYANVTMDHLRVAFVNGDGEVEVALAAVPVGGTGVLAPLEVSAALGSGPWRVVLRGEVQGADAVRARARGGEPFERVLFAEWPATAEASR